MFSELRMPDRGHMMGTGKHMAVQNLRTMFNFRIDNLNVNNKSKLLKSLNDLAVGKCFRCFADRHS